jgi:hypothetical protein
VQLVGTSAEANGGEIPLQAMSWAGAVGGAGEHEAGRQFRCRAMNCEERFALQCYVCYEMLRLSHHLIALLLSSYFKCLFYIHLWHSMYDVTSV